MRIIKEIDQDILHYVRPVTIAGGGTKFGVVVKKVGNTHTVLVDLGKEPELDDLKINDGKPTKLSGSDIKDIYFVELIEDSSISDGYDMLPITNQAETFFLIWQVEGTIVLGFFTPKDGFHAENFNRYSYTTDGKIATWKPSMDSVTQMYLVNGLPCPALAFDKDGIFCGMLTKVGDKFGFKMPKVIDVSKPSSNKEIDYLNCTFDYWKDEDKVTYNNEAGEEHKLTWKSFLDGFQGYLKNDRSLIKAVSDHAKTVGLHSSDGSDKAKSAVIAYCLIMQYLAKNVTNDIDFSPMSYRAILRTLGLKYWDKIDKPFSESCIKHILEKKDVVFGLDLFTNQSQIPKSNTRVVIARKEAMKSWYRRAEELNKYQVFSGTFQREFEGTISQSRIITFNDSLVKIGDRIFKGKENTHLEGIIDDLNTTKDKSSAIRINTYAKILSEVVGRVNFDIKPDVKGDDCFGIPSTQTQTDSFKFPKAEGDQYLRKAIFL